MEHCGYGIVVKNKNIVLKNQIFTNKFISMFCLNI